MDPVNIMHRVGIVLIAGFVFVNMWRRPYWQVVACGCLLGAGIVALVYSVPIK